MKQTVSRFIALMTFAALFAGCSVVRSYERGQLGDPIMEREDQFAKQSLSTKFFLSREGSIGGTLGIGGGCGCAK
ncbi:MAG: DUF4266 domain-containing protein [Ignavibacteria bacterium]|nr:DUF4266 domain-containing protein [Ignavibacteria bacterium]